MWRYETQSYILSLEPEDSPHFALPVKYMNYESIQYDRQYRRIQKKHQKRQDLRSPEYLSGFSEHDSLMPVITIGIYLGREEWSGFTTLTKMIGSYIGNRKLEIQKEEYGTKEGYDMCLAIQELIEDGRAEGRTEGIAAVNELMRCLFAEGKTDELFRSLQDFAYQKELMKAYGIQDDWTEKTG